MFMRCISTVDHGVAGDSDVFSFIVNELTPRIKRGEVLYIHCFGGHGRTGTIVALLLCMKRPSVQMCHCSNRIDHSKGHLYKITAEESLALTQLYQSSRRFRGYCPTPEMTSQIKQVA